jgi:hypothetical protein
MSTARPHPIVARALELERAHPCLPALQILDAAMDGHHGQDLNFELAFPTPDYGDWLDPPSPFADLVRRAFDAPSEAFDPTSARWQQIIDAFGDRYFLWR